MGVAAACIFLICGILPRNQAALTDTAINGIHVQDSSLASNPSSGQRDIVDIWYRVTHQPDKPRIDEKGFHPSIVPAAGYTMATGLAAVLSANLTFPSHAGKYSNILTSIAYTEKKQTILPFQASFWIDGDKYLLVTDLRFMNYPSTTFGLGSRAPLSAGDTIDFDYLKLHGSLMRKIMPDFYAGIGFYYDRFWDIQETGPPTGTASSLQKYGFTSTSTSAGPIFRAIYDSRKNPVAPEQGWFANLTLRSNLKLTGSDTNWHSLAFEARKYLRFPAHSPNTIALWTYNVFTLAGRPPYLMLPSTGWDDFYNTGRGYVQGRYRGRNMSYLEAEYRFRISHDGLFGGAVFGNLQTFSKDPTRQLHTVIPGFGTGIRLRINKYSGANLCIDYGFGLDGQRGISVNLGEVF
jgi:hypothetical protein